MPAFIRAILNLVPNFFPLFASGKGLPPVGSTGLLGQVDFFNPFHASTVFLNGRIARYLRQLSKF